MPIRLVQRNAPSSPRWRGWMYQVSPLTLHAAWSASLASSGPSGWEWMMAISVPWSSALAMNAPPISKAFNASSGPSSFSAGRYISARVSARRLTTPQHSCG
ncbi:hypothetical protein G6F57_023526 [Rhizopus arrhizus]|nr:hypothetical protein G6F57_023526 [Rhizopus arrhizus]